VSAELLEDSAGTLYVKFYFMEGGTVVLPYSDVIHLRRHYYNNDLLGQPEPAHQRDAFGNPHHQRRVGAGGQDVGVPPWHPQVPGDAQGVGHRGPARAVR